MYYAGAVIALLGGAIILLPLLCTTLVLWSRFALRSIRGKSPIKYRYNYIITETQ